MKSSRGAVLLVALVLVTAGCAQTTGTNPGAPDIDPASPDPLLQVVVAGGYVPAGTDFVRGADLTVYPDGRVISHGPIAAIYPGPALPNLQQAELSAADVESIVAKAEDAGLLGDIPDYGQPPITDTPTTAVTLRAGVETFVHAAYALTEGMGLPAPGPGEYGLTPDEVAARERLTGFLDEVRQRVDTASPRASYEPSAYAIQARQTPPFSDGPPTDPAPDMIEPVAVPWPLPELDLAAATDCLVVTGAAAQTLGTTLGEANALTRFEQNGLVYEVWVRPLLPGEDRCPDAG